VFSRIPGNFFRVSVISLPVFREENATTPAQTIGSETDIPPLSNAFPVSQPGWHLS
jgi:hypothetical protein